MVAGRQVAGDGGAGGQRHPLPDAGDGAGLRRAAPGERAGGDGRRPPPASPTGTSSASRWPQRGNRAWLSGLAPELDTLSALIDGLDPADDDGAGAGPAAGRAPDRRRPAPPRRARRSTPSWRGSPPPSPAVARLVLLSASLLGDAGQLDEAWRRCDEGEAMLDAVGDGRPVGVGAGRVAPGDAPAARPTRPTTLDRARDLAERAGRARPRPTATGPTPCCASPSWPAPAATATWPSSTSRCRRLARRVGDHVLVALALNNLVEEELRDGEVAKAAAHQRDALGLRRRAGDGAPHHLRPDRRRPDRRRRGRRRAWPPASTPTPRPAWRPAGCSCTPTTRPSATPCWSEVAARLGADAYAEARRGRPPTSPSSGPWPRPKRCWPPPPARRRSRPDHQLISSQPRWSSGSTCRVAWARPWRSVSSEPGLVEHGVGVGAGRHHRRGRWPPPSRW